jgi:segregation and condensation protein B
MPINENELRAAIEAVLLVAGEPITLSSLLEVFGEKEKESIEARLDEIQAAYEQAAGGYTLEKAAGGYRFVTRPEYDVYLKKFFSKQGEGRLSIASLETLAIVAYKQPITAPEIADIRGVNSSGVLRTLLDRKLIRIAGRKNVVGSPFLYKTTKDFLLHFGLNSIQDLPRLEEFAEILGDSLAEELLGSEDPPAVVDEIVGDSEGDVDVAPSSGDGDHTRAGTGAEPDVRETEEGGSSAEVGKAPTVLEASADDDDELDEDDEEGGEDDDDFDEDDDDFDEDGEAIETDDDSEEKSEVE